MNSKWERVAQETHDFVTPSHSTHTHTHTSKIFRVAKRIDNVDYNLLHYNRHRRHYHLHHHHNLQHNILECVMQKQQCISFNELIKEIKVPSLLPHHLRRHDYGINKLLESC